MTDEARDLMQAQAGCHEAFGRLYDRHAAVVHCLCRRCAVPDVEEAVQETFIRAARLIDQVAEASRLRAWLYGIARRVCRERRRSQARRDHHEGQASMLRLVEQSAAGDLCEAASRREQLERLTIAMEALPDDERLAVHLHYLEDDAEGAAHAALGLSRSGFYKLLARARKRLAEQMEATEAPPNSIAGAANKPRAWTTIRNAGGLPTTERA